MRHQANLRRFASPPLGNLAQARAQLKQNQLTLDRYTKLFKAAVIPQQTFDDATQATRAIEAEVQADEAAVESARLNLQWTKVSSPINGVANQARLPWKPLGVDIVIECPRHVHGAR